jgi:50S ribosomal protein L16 3-hydroxylase
LTPPEFLRRYWQKRPLFVPAALPRLTGMPGKRALAVLAARDDVESRMVQRRGRRWETTQGPFRNAFIAKRNASLLVSGVNLQVAAADRLLRRFDFIPQARLDDVMVSYASPGGGVGPHVDFYDVFLIQGLGVRTWTVWSPSGAKLNFLSSQGDLLYLPPGWKHDGVALEDCTTYSVGFRAPRGAELGAAFLDFLHERGLPDAFFRDPGLKPAGAAASIPVELIGFANQVLKKIRWSKADVTRFLGEYLTQPKPHVVFRASAGRGARVRLDAKTQLLYRGNRFFINGDSFTLPARAAAAMRALADRRELAAGRLASSAGLIGEWRRAGYLHLEKRPG